jgi:hypothetical protein
MRAFDSVFVMLVIYRLSAVFHYVGWLINESKFPVGGDQILTQNGDNNRINI